MKNIFFILSSLVLGAVSGPLAAANGAPITPPMVTVKGGTFLMGSSANPRDGDHPVSEPAFVVSVKTFRLSKYETTVGQFRQFVEATGYQVSGDCWKLAANGWGTDAGPVAWDSPANAPTEYHPVMCVSWNDAQAYLAWLSQATGKHYRLPSEAEWEYAAHAGSKARYPFGDDPTAACKYGNVFDRSGKAVIERLTGKPREEIACDDHAELTTVVGMYRPNAFGLYDMLGNVGEFVEDCQHADYEGAPSDGTAWTADCQRLHGSTVVVHRGGSYMSGPVDASPTYRGHAGRDNRSSAGEGFRIAETITDDAGRGTGEKKTAGLNPFETGLTAAQKAERARRKHSTPGTK